MNNFEPGFEGALTRTCMEGWGKTRQLWLESSLSMRLSYFPPLRSTWNFQLPFPLKEKRFSWGGGGVRPIASRRLYPIFMGYTSKEYQIFLQKCPEYNSLCKQNKSPNRQHLSNLVTQRNTCYIFPGILMRGCFSSLIIFRS